MSNDTQQMLRLLFFIGIMLLAPFQIAAALYFTYREVGAATWVGLAAMVAMGPANVFIFTMIGTCALEYLACFKCVFNGCVCSEFSEANAQVHG